MESFVGEKADNARSYHHINRRECERDKGRACKLPSNFPSMSIGTLDKGFGTFSQQSFRFGLWCIAAGTLISLGARFRNVFTFAFSPRCDVLAFASFVDANYTVRLWSVAERKEAHVLEQLGDEVIELCFSSDGNIVGFIFGGLRAPVGSCDWHPLTSIEITYW